MGEPFQPEWLRLPDETEIILVEDAETLAQAAQLLEEAYVCALDAEWEPYTKPFAASLVQLAVRCHGGGEYVLLVVRAHASTFPVLYCTVHVNLGGTLCMCVEVQACHLVSCTGPFVIF